MATNFSAGLNSGVQGAMAGAQVGGVWGAVIGGGLGLILGSQQAKEQQKMLEQYNKQVLKQHATDLFKLQGERNLEDMRTAAALLNYQDNLAVGTSTYNAQYGAADMIGSSAEAMAQVLGFQTSEAKAATKLNWNVSLDNYNTTIDQLTNQRQVSLQRSTGEQKTDFGGLIKTGLDAYSMYRSGNMTGMFGSNTGSTGQGGFFNTFTDGKKIQPTVNKIR